MECSETQAWLDPYVDGELGLTASLEVEAHLRSCPACALSYANRQALRTGLQNEALYFEAPADLQKRLARSLPQPAPRSFRPPSSRWSLAAAFVLAALLGWTVFHQPQMPGSSAVAQEVVASHIRSLMGSHLADVASTDQHTVKPWFNGRLDYSPPVKDLAAQGFPLIGGRLDYLGGRPVAALVYRRQKHLINLFVWPEIAASNAQNSPDSLTRQGYHVLHWDQADMEYWAVSDLNSAELTQFEHLIQAK